MEYHRSICIAPGYAQERKDPSDQPRKNPSDRPKHRQLPLTHRPLRCLSLNLSTYYRTLPKFTVFWLECVVETAQRVRSIAVRVDVISWWFLTYHSGQKLIWCLEYFITWINFGWFYFHPSSASFSRILVKLAKITLTNKILSRD